MPQFYRVLSADRAEGADAHGNLTYFLEVEDDAQTYTGVMLKQKPDTPVPSGQLYGRLEAKTSQKGNQYWRFFKERQEENGAPAAHSATEGQARGSHRSGGGSPSPEFWAQKDKRLARAGMTQAVVTAHPIQQGEEVGGYIARVSSLVDALLADLEKRAPSPNNTSTDAIAPGGASNGGGATAQPSSVAQAGGGAQDVAPPAPDFVHSQDYKLALAACGKDNSDPAKTYAALTPDEKGQVKTIYQNLSNSGEATVGTPIPANPDDEIPF